MFNVGDKVVHAMYGAGVIEGEKNERVNGQTEHYFVLHICLGDLRILISSDKTDSQELLRLPEADEVMEIINQTEPIEMPSNWMTRYNENRERLKTGKLEAAMQVYKTLTLRERVKSLSNREKKMLGSTKKFILSIIILSQDVDKEAAEKLLVSSVELEKIPV
jgi:CarD family transcriptional regulator